MDREGSADHDPAFRAVERVLTGAVSKVLSQYHQPRSSRGKRHCRTRPEIESSDGEDFAPPKKKYPTYPTRYCGCMWCSYIESLS